MVVMDTRPGSADDLWLCSWATALAAAVLSGDFSLPLGFTPLFPTSSAVGRDNTPLTSTRTTALASRAWCVFLRFLRAHISLEMPPCPRSTPPSWPSLCRPEAVAWPHPLSSPFMRHLPFPHHILVIPPRVLLPSTSPPPLVCLAHVRGDLPLGVASCVPEN